MKIVFEQQVFCKVLGINQFDLGIPKWVVMFSYILDRISFKRNHEISAKPICVVCWGEKERNKNVHHLIKLHHLIILEKKISEYAVKNVLV